MLAPSPRQPEREEWDRRWQALHQEVHDCLLAGSKDSYDNDRYKNYPEHKAALMTIAVMSCVLEWVEGFRGRH